MTVEKTRGRPIGLENTIADIGVALAEYHMALELGEPDAAQQLAVKIEMILDLPWRRITIPELST